MKLTKLFLLLASTSALVTGSAGLALAAAPTSAKADLPVSATVVKSCSIQTSEVAFGDYNPLSGVKNASGSVSVTCSKGSGTSVALDYGRNTAAGTGTQPYMTDGTNFLKYMLYSDPDHLVQWNGTSVPITPATADVPTAQLLYVYGQIPALQNVAPGSYTDTVYATVNF